ncbi:YxiG-like protein [Streptomyces flaveolus]|uniref:YxiG-like protein n=1 Tax=Streptomyces flaveolus TaxID=67297 RepID=UPI003F55899E
MATRRWSKALGTDIHEVRMETNAHNVTLLFSWDGVIRVMPSGRPGFGPRGLVCPVAVERAARRRPAV